MHIAFFTDTFSPAREGVTTAILQARAGLHARGHRVTVVTVAKPGALAEPDVLRVPALPYRGGVHLGLPALRRPPHEVDLIHTHTEFSLGWAGRHLARALGVPHIHTAHTLYGHYRHYAPFIPPGVAYAAWARFMRPCAAVICPSETMQTLVRQHAPSARTVYLPNGLDAARFRPLGLGPSRADLGLGSADRVVLSVGRLSREKRPRALLAALAPLLRAEADIQLLLIGEGPLKAALQRDARRGGIAGQVHLPGGVPWAGMPEVYEMARVYASASLSENDPMTYLEARACGLPIVARSGTPDALGSDGALAAQVRAWLTGDGFAPAPRQVSLGSHVSALCEVYQAALSQLRAPPCD